MPVDLSHTFTVPTSVDVTWAHFQDIASVAGCFPGATVTSVEGDTFRGSCKVKLGPIVLVYNGSGTFVEKDEAAHRFVVDAKGKDKRGNGTAGAKVTLSMTGDADGTSVEVLTDLAVTGKPAQFGRGMMQDVSDKLLGQFVQCLEDRLGAPAVPETAPEQTADQDADQEADQDAAPASEPFDTPRPSATQELPTGAAAVAAPPGDTDAGPASTPERPSAPPPRDNDTLNLGATVLPVLLKSYWKQGAIGLLVVAVVIWLVTRR